MSIEAIAWAKAQRIASAPQKLLYILLADRISNETGTCFPGQELLAEEATMCKRAVRTHLNALEAAYYIKRSRRFKPDGSPTSDQYEFPGFMDWRGVAKADAREVHEKHANDRQRSTTGRNLPPVDLGADHRQVYVATTGRNLPPNPKENTKKNPKISAQQAAPGAREASPELALPCQAHQVAEAATKPERKPAAKGGDEFEAAWEAYRKASSRLPGSKTKALAQFERLAKQDRSPVIPAIKAYAADCAKQQFGRGDHRHMADMNRFLADYFAQFAPEQATSEEPAKLEQRQVRAVAMDLADGERPNKIVAFGWRSFADVPSQLCMVAFEYAKREFLWRPSSAFALQVAA
jgi:Helix-turn-helix domain